MWLAAATVKTKKINTKLCELDRRVWRGGNLYIILEHFHDWDIRLSLNYSKCSTTSFLTTEREIIYGESGQGLYQIKFVRRWIVPVSQFLCWIDRLKSTVCSVIVAAGCCDTHAATLRNPNLECLPDRLPQLFSVVKRNCKSPAFCIFSETGDDLLINLRVSLWLYLFSLHVWTYTHLFVCIYISRVPETVQWGRTVCETGVVA